MTVKEIPRVGVLVDLFKQFSKSLGWIVTDQDDWIWSGAEYHKFFWLERLPLDVTPSFRKLVSNDVVYVRYKQDSFTLDKASYTAWIFSIRVPSAVFELVARDPDILVRTAIYDLYPAYDGESECLKLNQTRSVVFDEFERFLKSKYGVELVEIIEPWGSSRWISKNPLEEVTA